MCDQPVVWTQFQFLMCTLKNVVVFLQSESDWYLIDWLIAIWGWVCGQSVYIYKERGDIRKGWWGKFGDISCCKVLPAVTCLLGCTWSVFYISNLHSPSSDVRCPSSDVCWEAHCQISYLQSSFLRCIQLFAWLHTKLPHHLSTKCQAHIPKQEVEKYRSQCTSALIHDSYTKVAVQYICIWTSDFKCADDYKLDPH